MKQFDPLQRLHNSDPAMMSGRLPSEQFAALPFYLVEGSLTSKSKFLDELAVSASWPGSSRCDTQPELATLLSNASKMYRALLPACAGLGFQPVGVQG